MTTLVWLRQDLRLADNPALYEAAIRGPVLPVYIIDDTKAVRALGGASKWWLHHSLTALKAALPGLVLFRGEPIRILRDLAGKSGATAVFWNRCYEPDAIARDTLAKSGLREAGLEVESFNASLLHEPWEVETNQGGPFKVYSPFWRAALAKPKVDPLPAPTLQTPDGAPSGIEVAELGLLPTKPNWAEGWEQMWQPGEVGAKAAFERFLESGLKGYGTLRNRPDLPNVSRLSPHLHFGEISPRQIWSATRMAQENGAPRKDGDKFLSEVGWREFSYHLLYHFPTLPTDNWKPTFDAYPWRESRDDLRAWQRGITGYPFVDAGMRELWHTGYMHNRVRMVVASFLVKHLRLHWRHGEDWFWDTLLDADGANNSASWQWVTGSGADAAPYFRIFNPITQGSKFDPDGAYIRKWCPELAKLPDQFLFWPSDAPELVLKEAGVMLGDTYPRPMVDHKAAREA
ncbi:MAG: deoxyribodipyrimidine photo-lyase, partial [Pseudomonadota bacterium]